MPMPYIPLPQHIVYFFILEDGRTARRQDGMHSVCEGVNYMELLALWHSVCEGVNYMGLPALRHRHNICGSHCMKGIRIYIMITIIVEKPACRHATTKVEKWWMVVCAGIVAEYGDMVGMCRTAGMGGTDTYPAALL